MFSFCFLSPGVAVTSREGRVSRNLVGRVEGRAGKVTSREGRVSRNWCQYCGLTLRAVTYTHLTLTTKQVVEGGVLGG